MCQSLITVADADTKKLYVGIGSHLNLMAKLNLNAEHCLSAEIQLDKPQSFSIERTGTNFSLEVENWARNITKEFYDRFLRPSDVANYILNMEGYPPEDLLNNLDYLKECLNSSGRTVFSKLLSTSRISTIVTIEDIIRDYFFNKVFVDIFNIDTSSEDFLREMDDLKYHFDNISISFDYKDIPDNLVKEHLTVKVSEFVLSIISLMSDYTPHSFNKSNIKPCIDYLTEILYLMVLQLKDLHKDRLSRIENEVDDILSNSNFISSKWLTPKNTEPVNLVLLTGDSSRGISFGNDTVPFSICSQDSNGKYVPVIEPFNVKVYGDDEKSRLIINSSFYPSLVRDEYSHNFVLTLAKKAEVK
jgi:hypothetical protein